MLRLDPLQKSLTDNQNAHPLSQGALDLLTDCVGGQSGERLLIVEEPKGCGYFDDDAPQLTAAAARALGLLVYSTQAPETFSNAEQIARFIDILRGFDHVVFFARVGDQIRFSDFSGMPPSTMVYALDKDMLDSAFGTACYQGLCEVKSLLDEAFTSARHIRVTCPRGTDYAGRPDSAAQNPSREVSLKRFPMLVPRPISAQGFSGRVVLSRFLTGTGSHFYEPYTLPLDSDVHAIVRNSRLLRFEGCQTEIDKVNKHYHDIASRFDIDPWYVHSWHAGIHPACTFKQDARQDTLRWSGSAFGNPRILHFHTCGDYAPGEISWSVVDPTIVLDEVAVWEDGNLHPERLPGGRELLARHPRLFGLYQVPLRDIGIQD